MRTNRHCVSDTQMFAQGGFVGRKSLPSFPYTMDTSAALLVLRSTQVQSMADEESSETEWGKNIARVTEFAQEKAGGFASQYNETAWFPVARDAITHFMEVRALLGSLLGGICPEVWCFRQHLSSLSC